MRTKLKGTFPAREMRPGDVISLEFAEPAYNTAMVESIDESGTITVVRPYQQCADFDCCTFDGETQRILYIGTESIKLMGDVLVNRVYTARND